MALIEKQYYWVEKESVSHPVEVTSQPVEKGIDLIDHVQRGAKVLSVSGACSGPDAAKKL
uniref:phage baseplate protein n=1 Tax=Paenibacillus campi TaxID=3106031 RepID=UPI003A4C5AD4